MNIKGKYQLILLSISRFRVVLGFCWQCCFSLHFFTQKVKRALITHPKNEYRSVILLQSYIKRKSSMAGNLSRAFAPRVIFSEKEISPESNSALPMATTSRQTILQKEIVSKANLFIPSLLLELLFFFVDTKAFIFCSCWEKKELNDFVAGN